MLKDLRLTRYRKDGSGIDNLDIATLVKHAIGCAGIGFSGCEQRDVIAIRAYGTVGVLQFPWLAHTPVIARGSYRYPAGIFVVAGNIEGTGDAHRCVSRQVVVPLVEVQSGCMLEAEAVSDIIEYIVTAAVERTHIDIAGVS